MKQTLGAELQFIVKCHPLMFGRLRNLFTSNYLKLPKLRNAYR